MDYNTVEDATLFYLKFLQNVMIQEDLGDFLDEAEELGIQYTTLPFLELTRDLVKAYTKHTRLPLKINDNLFYFVGKCRFISEKETSSNRKRRFQLCNEIVEAIHDSSFKPQYPFYQSLANYFYLNPVERALYCARLSLEEEGAKQQIRALAGSEYYILYSQSTLVTEEEFIEFAVNYLLNFGYLRVVRNLLQKIPKLRHDEVFLTRTKKVLDLNDQLLEEAKGNPILECECTLEEDDKEIVENKSFWKLQEKVKRKVANYQKDS